MGWLKMGAMFIVLTTDVGEQIGQRPLIMFEKIGHTHILYIKGLTILFKQKSYVKRKKEKRNEIEALFLNC